MSIFQISSLLHHLRVSIMKIPTICMYNLNNVFEVHLFGLLIAIIQHGMK